MVDAAATIASIALPPSRSTASADCAARECEATAMPRAESSANRRAARASDVVLNQPHPDRAAFLAIIDTVIDELKRIQAEATSIADRRPIAN